MTNSRPGWLTLDEALAIVCMVEHDKPEPTPELVFAHGQATALIRLRAEQAMKRLVDLNSTETHESDQT